MKLKVMTIVLFAALLLPNAVAFAKEAQTSEPAAAQNEITQCLNSPAVKLQADLRKAWINHTIWTRSYIVSALADLPDQESVLNRLLKNQVDIGNAIKPYYGEEAGNKLTVLLKEHIQIAGKIVDAAKSGNTADVQKFNKEWHRNADDIAKFLSSANPNWSQKELQDMLYQHLAYIAEQLKSRMQNNFEAEIEAVDKNEDHMIHLADILTLGIIKQFPSQF